MTDSTTTINNAGTTRPSSHDDLKDHQREGHLVATIVSENLVKYPSLGQHLLAALAEATHLGLDVADGAIRIALTDEELDRALASDQRSWDYQRDGYLKAIDDASSISESYRRSWIDTWAAAEGLPLVAWPVSA